MNNILAPVVAQMEANLVAVRKAMSEAKADQFVIVGSVGVGGDRVNVVLVKEAFIALALAPIGEMVTMSAESAGAYLNERRRPLMLKGVNFLMSRQLISVLTEREGELENTLRTLSAMVSV